MVWYGMVWYGVYVSMYLCMHACMHCGNVYAQRDRVHPVLLFSGVFTGFQPTSPRQCFQTTALLDLVFQSGALSSH